MWYWIFAKESIKKYIVLSESEFDGSTRRSLLEDGYEVFCDIMKSYRQANEYMREFYNDYRVVKFIPQPINFKAAKEFINKHHRHHIAPQGYKFAVAITDGDTILGIGVAGRPVSRYRDDGLTLEVTRCCTREGYKNLCSKIYSSIIKIAKELGYKKVITYTLEEEPGISLIATGFDLVNISQGGSWSSSNRKRRDKHPTGVKKVWELKLAN